MAEPRASTRSTLISLSWVYLAFIATTCLILAFKDASGLFFVAASVGFVVSGIGSVLGISAARRRGGIGAKLMHLAVVTSLLGILVTLLYLALVDDVLRPSRRTRSRENLERLALAILQYERAHGSLPPSAIRDGSGAPLLSWRVAILPFLGEQNLFREFKLDERWDSPSNLSLLARMPAVYCSPGPNRGGQHETFYQVLVGPGTAFERPGLKLTEDFPDGPAETILIVEAAESVPWTKPVDVVFDDAPLLPRLGGRTRNSYMFDRGYFQANIVMADGSSHGITPAVKEYYLRAAATRNGAEVLPGAW